MSTDTSVLAKNESRCMLFTHCGTRRFRRVFGSTTTSVKGYGGRRSAQSRLFCSSSLPSLSRTTNAHNKVEEYAYRVSCRICYTLQGFQCVQQVTLRAFDRCKEDHHHGQRKAQHQHACVSA